jgi:hypothetical protein
MTLVATSPPAPVMLGARPLGVGRLLLTGAIVAALDGLAAVALHAGILHTMSPAALFGGIAALALGPDAPADRATRAWVGVAVHVGVAFAWTAAYGTAYRRSHALRHAVASRATLPLVAVAFGTLVWVTMSFVVLPSFGARRPSPTSAAFLATLIIHWMCVGLPIVTLVRQRAV